MAKKSWLGKLKLRKGALIIYARSRGGISADGKINKTWARQEQSRLRAKSSRTTAETTALRRLNLYINRLSKR